MADEKSQAGAKNGAKNADVALVRELAKLLKENDLSEIEVEDEDRKIRIARILSGTPVTQMVSAPAAAAPAPAAPAAAPAPASEDHAGAVKSPMVGTAFLQPDPAAPPFKAVGDSVKEGDTVLIIEAMKVMNAIAAPRGGKLTKMLVESGQPVEFDQPLFVIA